MSQAREAATVASKAAATGTEAKMEAAAVVIWGVVVTAEGQTDMGWAAVRMAVDALAAAMAAVALVALVAKEMAVSWAVEAPGAE